MTEHKTLGKTKKLKNRKIKLNCKAEVEKIVFNGTI